MPNEYFDYETGKPRVKTGQDLVDLGVKPKSSSRHMSLITLERLNVIANQVVSQINEEKVGGWFPVITEKRVDIGTTEVTDEGDMKKYAKSGMRVEGIDFFEHKDIREKSGVIKAHKDQNFPERRVYAIEFEKRFSGGSSLEGKCAEGRGMWVAAESLKLFVPDGKVVDGYELVKGVVADDQLGHKVRFTRGYSGRVRNSSNRSKRIELEPGRIGMMRELDRESLKIHLEEPIDRSQIFYFQLEDIANTLEVSSLGQIEPQDKEKMVMDEVFRRFFPNTRLDTGVAYKTVMGLIMGKDLDFVGPPGSGKSQLCKDIIEIAMMQNYIFQVEGCHNNCNPFSLFDEEFAREIPPCQECKMNYFPDFQKTGIFIPPKAKDVKVVVAKYGQGHGIESIEGSVSLQRMHLAGYKLPKLDGSTDSKMEDEANPKGFKPGALIRTHNGDLFIDELDKIRPSTLDSLLRAIQDEKIKPDEVKYELPCNALIVATSNSTQNLSDALNDRLLLLTIRYPEDPEANFQVMRSAYHREVEPVEAIVIGDTHKLEGDVLRQIPMPVIIEQAVIRSYMKFIDEYQGVGRLEIHGSNRCRIDALDSSRAKLTLDRLFYEDTPRIVSAKYAIAGMQFALSSRVGGNSKQKDSEIKGGLNNWIAENFPAVLEQERENWWCEAHQHIARAKKQAPEIETYFFEEIERYKQDPGSAIESYGEVKYALGTDDLDAKIALIKYPFMDYLFAEQPRIDTMLRDPGDVNQKAQFIELINYFMQSQEGVACAS